MIKIETISRHMAKNIEKTKRPMIKIETISRHMAKNIEKDKTTND
jgi:hypothetical protein